MRSRNVLRHPSILTLGLWLTACPTPGGGGGSGDECGEDNPCAAGLVCEAGKCRAEASTDAGTGGPITPTCDYDTDCGVGEICVLEEGACAPGLDCSQNPTICGFCEGGGQDCGFAPYPAFCDPNAGVCRRVHTSCQPCHSHAECTPSYAAYDNHCVEYDDGRFCAADCGHGQSCPRGFTCDGDACRLEPMLGRCLDAPACTAATEASVCPTGTYCTTRGAQDPTDLAGVCLGTCLEDADCPSPQICRTDPGPRYGTCIDGCRPPGTTAGDSICHETGRFGAYCATHSDCLGITALGGFECHDGQGSCESACEGWCVQGGCDDSSECPLPRTYCELSTRECLVGCAVDSDCGAFELCDVASHTCHTQPCRGKDLSCDLEQWCCGTELYDGSAAPEHRDCPADVEFGTCFEMRDPYCRQCEDNDDCGDIAAFGYGSNCYELKTEDENGEEVSLGKYCSVGCEANADCPRGISCIQELPTSDGGTIKGCIDARCVP